MTERALLFLISLAALIGGLAAAVWLAATDQLGTFDGNFLFLTALLVAGSFALYLRYLIRNARAVPPPPPAKKAEPAGGP